MKERYSIFQYSYLINFNFQYFNQHAVEVLKHSVVLETVMTVDLVYGM